MYVLGISFGYHDSSAALIKNGEVIFAAQEERYTRIKHDNSFPKHSIKEALKFAKIELPDINQIAYYEDPLIKYSRVLNSISKNILSNFKKGILEFYNETYDWIKYDKFNIKEKISSELNFPPQKIFISSHHLSHASSVFFNSNFKSSSIITIDGVGEKETITFSNGKNNKITKIKSFNFPHSLGLFYSTITAFLGFEVNEGEYKVMGMAAYGKPKYKDNVGKLIYFNKKKFILNLDFFNFDNIENPPFTEKFILEFGDPRDPDSSEQKDPLNKKFLYYADLAASFQSVLEDIVLKMIDQVVELTGEKNLCFSGGVALNAVLNGKILGKKKVNLYIFPAAGDAGTAVGAALYFYYSILNKERVFYKPQILLGSEYEDKTVDQAIEFYNEKKFKKYNSDIDLVNEISKILQENKVIGFFQGRSEFGPRALGSRSILANPAKINMRDIINEKIKFREAFRPFAPVILAERAKFFFEIDKIDNFYQLENFMLSVTNVIPQKSHLFPSAISVDKTARVQIVWKENDKNSLLRKVLEKFDQDTGLPMLINTSFNRRGEPIVENPNDALKVFYYTDLDYLIINNYIISK